MGFEPRYTLLIIGDEYLSSELDHNFVGKYFVYEFSKQKVEDEAYYDVILELENLELHHGFNGNLIINLESISSLNNNIDQIISSIKYFDFDIELGIEMLGGLKDLFLDFLKNYLTNYSSVEKDFVNFFKNANFDEIRKVVHKIKGVSLYLGSEKLLAYATELESKIYNSNFNEKDILNFINYHNRILKYVKEQVENV